MSLNVCLVVGERGARGVYLPIGGVGATLTVRRSPTHYMFVREGKVMAQASRVEFENSTPIGTVIAAFVNHFAP